MIKPLVLFLLFYEHGVCVILILHVFKVHFVFKLSLKGGKMQWLMFIYQLFKACITQG